MVQGLELLLALLLGLLRLGKGQPLLVEPREPVVAVALGTSQKLTCSLACAHGMATVHWRGLDTSLGTVQSEPGRSVLWLRSASLADAGTRVCRGSCGAHTFQHRVEVLVYAFPEQLTVSPAALQPGQDREVTCTAHNVTPWGPDTLSFSLLLGDQELEGVQVLGWEEAEEEASLEAEDPLFRVTQRWLLPTLRTPIPTTLHCQATMQLPSLKLSHRQPLPALCSNVTLMMLPLSSLGKGPTPTPSNQSGLGGGLEGSTPTPVQMGTLRGGEGPGAAVEKWLLCVPVLRSQTTPEPPSLSSPETPSSTSLKPFDLTSLEPPNSISTAHPDSISTAHPDSISAAHPDSISAAYPYSISTELPESPSSQSTPEQAPLRSPSSAHSCHPEIRQAPPAALEKVAGWGLLCQASCGPGVTVRWTLAPGGLAAYNRREAGTWAQLSAPLLTNPTPEGWFQCRLEPGGQVANLYVQGQNAVPSTSSSPEVVQLPAALWLGSMALGLLLLLALVAYRLWKHCWPAARDLTHPPVCLGLLPVQDSKSWLGFHHPKGPLLENKGYML
ncbi:mucosal addressin cell adhesion molecule 1 [Erethizon dorsatum]